MLSVLASPAAPSAAAPGPVLTRLILVHGTPGAATGWADYLQTPPPGMEVFALDRPGFGSSGSGRAWPSLDDQASAVAALLPDDDRPVVLLGHSLGGAVAARVAADHPHRVAGLVLLAASLSPDLEVVHPLQRIGDWPPLRALLPRNIRHANSELLTFEAELRTLQTRLNRVRARVAIVHGSLDDLVPVANVPYMQAELSGAQALRTMVLPGRNHFLPWNSADVVREAIAWASMVEGGR
jgi:pimeloyl-ACP methyl ester carboxylesterase